MSGATQSRWASTSRSSRKSRCSRLADSKQTSATFTSSRSSISRRSKCIEWHLTKYPLLIKISSNLQNYIFPWAQSQTLLWLRLHIHQNIALTFIKMGQYLDAASNYEIIFKERPDFKIGFNLILCYYALGDRNKMKQCFMELLRIPIRLPDDDDYQSHPTDKQVNLVLEVTRDDNLRRFERKKYFYSFSWQIF